MSRATTAVDAGTSAMRGNTMPLDAIAVRALRERLGTVGVWLESIGRESASTGRAAARDIESLGYRTLWIGSADTKDAFAHAAIVLSATTELVVATGIANIYARDPISMRLGALTLADAYPGRFLLGIGVSHARFVAARGHEYTKPVPAMRTYLERMAATQSPAPTTASAPGVVLAALRPGMLRLAGERADGAHPYFVPVSHTQRARTALGRDRLLAPELMVLVEDDAKRARAIARRTASAYLQLPNYVENLRSLGYDDDDFANGGSDQLIDDIIAWGSPEDIQHRIQEHLEAGADHVPVQPLGDLDAQMRQLRTLAPVLLP